MIPVNAQIVNQQSGVTKEIGFSAKVKNLGVLFRICRSQLYSDEKLAVIREYSVNAADAHVAAGKKNEPIIVTLPTQLDPFIKIRDFGLGLSDEEIQDVYASYGESSKRNTQDEAGMLGIGSKSAFAYVDSFIVNSYKDGVLTSWNSYIDPSDLGKMAQMVQCETNEPNGIEIVVPVKAVHIEEFKSKACDFFKYWTHQPIFKNISQEELEWFKATASVKPLLEGKDWAYYSDSRPSVAVMGQIAYPLNYREFTNYEVDSSIASGFLQNGLVIHFNIGDIDFSASREAVKYTPATKKVIAERIKKISEEMVKLGEQKIQNVKTLWEAKQVWYETYAQSDSPFYKIRHLTGSKVTFNGKAISGNTFKTYGEGITCRKYTRETNSDYNGNSQIIGIHNTVINSIRATDKALVIENDKHMKNGITNRVISYLWDRKYDEVYVIDFTSPEHKDAWFKETDFDGPVLKLSECVKEKLSKYFPNDPNEVSASQKSKYASQEFVYIYDVGMSRYNAKSDFWKTQDIDLQNSSQVYIKIERFEVWMKNGSINHPNEIKNYLNGLKALGIPIPEIVGLKEKTFSKIPKDSKMIHFEDWMNQMFKDYCQSHPAEIQQLVDYEYYRTYCNTYVYNKLCKTLATLTKNPLILKFVSDAQFLLKNYEAHEYSSSGAIKVLSRLKKEFNWNTQAEPTFKTEDSLNEIRAKYPLIMSLLEHTDCGREEALKTDMSRYMDYIDSLVP